MNKKLKILVIDDDLVFFDKLEREYEEFEFLLAKDEYEALIYIEEQSKTQHHIFDLILIDVILDNEYSNLSHHKSELLESYSSLLTFKSLTIEIFDRLGNNFPLLPITGKVLNDKSKNKIEIRVKHNIILQKPFDNHEHIYNSIIEHISVDNKQTSQQNLSCTRESIRIIILYSDEDCLYKDAIKKHLKVLQTAKKNSTEIIIWEKNEISAGEAVEDTTISIVKKSDICLCLISVDFINEITDRLPLIAELHGKGLLKVIPIIVKQVVLWQSFSPFDKNLRSLPNNGKTLATIDPNEFSDVVHNIVTEIIQVIDNILEERNKKAPNSSELDA